MKRVLYFLSAVMAIFAVSCNKNEIPVNNEGDTENMVDVTILASATDGGDFKTTATKEGSVYKIRWEEGDELSVFNTSKTMTKFTAASAGDKTEFNGEIPVGTEVTYAILPYDETATLPESGKDVLTSIPSEQSGDFSNIVLAGWPMDEEKEETKADPIDIRYQFEAVCGIVKFHFDPSKIAEGKTITAISFISDLPISGDCKINHDGKKPVMTMNPNATRSNVYNVVNLRKKEGFTEGDYYIATFPINVSDDKTGMKISLKFETSDGMLAYKNATLQAKGEEGSKYIFAANRVKNIGTVTISEYQKPFTSGDFTVAPGRKVKFSPGNLQYQASGNNGEGLWRFALNQWDAMGTVGNCTSPSGQSNDGPRATQSEWIDLFPWGHTGWTYNDVVFHPYRACADETLYCFHYNENRLGSDKFQGLTGDFEQGDWGKHCSILNGDTVDAPGTWRLITFSEFNYLMHSQDEGGRTVNKVDTTTWEPKSAPLTYLRAGIKLGITDASGKEVIRYGFMLFPDGFKWPKNFAIPFDSNTILIGYQFVDNAKAPKYSLSELEIFESLGVVFLPAAGRMYKAEVAPPYRVLFSVYTDGGSSFNVAGHYWTSTYQQHMALYPSNNTSADGLDNVLESVRLVKDVE